MILTLFSFVGLAAAINVRPVHHKPGVSKTAPTLPNRYFVQGSFEIPYFGTVETITAWTDVPNDMQKIDYYGGMDTYIYRYDHQKAYEIVPQIDKKVCFATNVTGPSVATGHGDIKPKPQVMPLVPDISDWAYNGTATIKGVQTDAWQTIVTNVTQYGTGVSIYTMYLDSNQQPVLLRLDGINDIMGSHPDVYLFYYHQFEQGTFTADVFDVPSMCLTNNQATSELLARRSAFRTANVLQRLGRVVPPMHTYMECSHDVADEFLAFTLRHRKRYAHCHEHAHRQRQYFANKRFVDAWNADPANTHTVELNHLADMSDDEYRAVVLQPRNGEARRRAHASATHTLADVVPTGLHMAQSLDWRAKGAVTPVKDQGACGSCWTFGSTGALEGAWFLKHGALISLSEQQIVDCAWGYFGAMACDGGLAPGAYQYLIDVGGLGTEQSYAYLAQDGWCNNNDHSSGVVVAGYVNVTGIPDMYKAVAQGPVAIAIDASLPSFRFYKSGIYNDPACKSDEDDLDHEVLAVGWGQDNGQAYWIVKNSWSTHWGNQGYINMAVKGNVCGVTTQATLPLAA